MRQVQYNLCSTCEAKEAVPPKPYVTVAYVTRDCKRVVELKLETVMLAPLRRLPQGEARSISLREQDHDDGRE